MPGVPLLSDHPCGVVFSFSFLVVLGIESIALYARQVLYH
jgi:hypothetical protein